MTYLTFFIYFFLKPQLLFVYEQTTHPTYYTYDIDIGLNTILILAITKTMEANCTTLTTYSCNISNNYATSQRT